MRTHTESRMADIAYEESRHDLYRPEPRDPLVEAIVRASFGRQRITASNYSGTPNTDSEKMEKQVACKFCKRPGKVVIDDAYAIIGDPFGLLRLYSCNSCSDYETARRAVVRNVKRICEMLIQRAVVRDDMGKARESLETLIKRYMRLYAEHNNLALAEYEPQLVDALMGKPTHFGQVLCRIPALFEQRALI